jgi:hypothetical protein
MVTMGNTEDGYGNLSTVVSVIQSTSWWLDMGNKCSRVCSYIYVFYLPGRPGFFHFDGEWSHTSVHGVNIVDLKFTLGKIM